MGRDWSGPELRALKRMHWLEELVLANDDSITDEQLVRFGKSPDCIIPNLAVMIRRLSPEFSRISCSMISDDGKLAFLGQRQDGVPVAVVGERTIVLGRRPVPGYPDLAVRELVSVVDNEPLWIDTHAFLADELSQGDWDNKATWRLRLGKKVVFETRGVTAFLPLRDGSYVYCMRTAEDGMHNVLKFKNGKHEPLIVRCQHPIHRFVETNDGSIWFFWLEGDSKVPMCARIATNDKTLFPDTERSKVEWITDVVDTDNGVRFVLQPVGNEFDIGMFERTQDGEIWLHCYKGFNDDVVYVSGLTQFADDKFAYIGKARHGKMRWVVDGVPQPAMDWVGPLCKDPAFGQRYLALSGRHIIEMLVP